MNNDSYAQQDALYSQYMFNQVIFNPAATGVKGGINVNTFVRNQWVGFPGAPKINTLSIDWLINDDKSAVGSYVIQDNIGARSGMSAFVTYAHWIKLTSKTRLSFGLSGGILQDILDGSKLDPNQINDTYLPSGVQKRIYPDVDAGMYITNDNFFSGISATRLVSSFNKNQNNGWHMYAIAGLVKPINDDIKLYPSLMLKNDFKAPMQYDISAMVLLKEAFWMGISYRNSLKNAQNATSTMLTRSENTFSVIARVNMFKRFNLGYAYDYSPSSFINNVYSAGTHEISLSAFFSAPKPLGVGLQSPRCYF